MAQWILHRPPRHSNASEIRVAEHLKRLDDRWSVVWGFYYKDNGGSDREGDFLVLGPTGGLLVLEVKGWIPRHFPDTGEWEGETGSPVDQLMDEWGSVRRSLQERIPQLWVAKALCCPTEAGSTSSREYRGIPRDLVVLGNDLAAWSSTWSRLFPKTGSQPVSEKQRKAVLQMFGHGATPSAKAAFLDHTEQLFHGQLTRDFGILEQLDCNQQLLVSGGTGTGKTWHALEQAYRYAARGEGKRVLLLIYNLALTAQLRRLVAMRQLAKGAVEVLAWEELFRSLVAAAGEVLEPPGPQASPEETRAFYEHDLPAKVLEISHNPARRSAWPRFDALVVDEGQDHDTCFDPTIAGADEAPGGWWGIYRLLLNDGRAAPVSVFFDSAQRPPFRRAEWFDPAAIASAFSQPAWFHLTPAVRYTRNLWSFLTSHRAPAIAGMIDSLGGGDHLPEGPEPEVIHVDPGNGTVRTAVEEIIARWQMDGLCQPHEVLILHRQATIERSPLGPLRVLAGRWNLRDCQEAEIPADAVRHTSINKAKGLDAKAVVVVGLPPFDQLRDDFAHYTWFMAASRARQLLAVVHDCPSSEDFNSLPHEPLRVTIPDLQHGGQRTEVISGRGVRDV